MTYLLRRARSCVRRLGALPLALVLAAAMPSAAQAFCRTTTTPLPASYSPSRGCFAEGLPLFWKNACVGYTINRQASAGIPLTTATTVIDEAFGTWNAVACPRGAVGIQASDLGPVDCSEARYNTNGANQNVIVFRENKWPYSDPNNTLGLTTVTFNADTGEIYDADMEINATGKNVSAAANVPANGYDLASVVTHEAGHFLGLAHATDASATMYASYKPGTTTLRSLRPDDVAGICAIYPTAAERTVDKTISATGTLAADACDPTPRHGFSSDCGSSAAPVESNTGGGCAVTPAPRRGETGGGEAALLVLALGVLASGRRASRRGASPTR